MATSSGVKYSTNPRAVVSNQATDSGGGCSLNSVSRAAQDITTGLTPQDRLDDTTFTARTNFNPVLPAGGFTFGIIKDQVGFFIRALEQITDTDILANPKVLALNKQVGQIIVAGVDEERIQGLLEPDRRKLEDLIRKR